MTKSICRYLAIAVIFLFALSAIMSNAAAKDAPSDIAAALLIKLAEFEKNIAGNSNDITIHAMGDKQAAEELKKGIEQKIGQVTLKKVNSSDILPDTKPSILFIGNSSKLDQAFQYTQAEKILSVTGKPEMVSEGVSLGIGVGDNNKPTFFLNLASSMAEGLNWNPAVMKITKTIE